MRKTIFRVGVGLVLLAGAALAGERDEPGTFRLNRDATLYERPSADAPIVRRLRSGTVVKVVRVTDQWYEVHSTRGNPSGFLRRSYADPFHGRRGREVQAGLFTLKDPVIVRSRPDIDAPAVTTLEPGTKVQVVERVGNWYRIESETGNRPPGYIPVIAAERL